MIRKYISEGRQISPQNAFDFVQTNAANHLAREHGIQLFGSLDDISLLYHAANHFGLKVVGREVRGKVVPVTKKIKARKAGDWCSFVISQNMMSFNIDDILKGRSSNKKSSSTIKKENGPSPTTTLEQLIGLNDVKKQIRDIGHLMKNRKDRERAGLPAITMSQHLVFTGNPGTGKTTVARLVGQIYRESGLLKKGQFIEIDGRGLIGEYVGQTATKARGIISKALDGVLFIDEAYSLVQGNGKNDYGPEAIATLIKMMEDNRDRLVVIIAGYGNEIEELLSSNPGLKSRFKTKIYFPDYAADELQKIFLQLCRENSYVLTKEAHEKARKLFAKIHENKGEQFGNGRSVRNMFDRCVLNHSRRLASNRNPTKKELQTLYQADIPVLKDVEW